MEYALQPATPENLKAVLTWVTTPELLKFWGGPALTFPPLPGRTWHEIGATGKNSFSLIGPKGNVLGFGQTLFRAPTTVHLGRIIVSPTIRGKGLGRLLCQQLIQTGSTRYQPSEFTLSVYKNNAPALNLYKSLGFAVLSEDPEQNSFKMCLRLNQAINSKSR